MGYIKTSCSNPLPFLPCLVISFWREVRSRHYGLLLIWLCHGFRTCSHLLFFIQISLLRSVPTLCILTLHYTRLGHTCCHRGTRRRLSYSSRAILVFQISPYLRYITFSSECSKRILSKSWGCCFCRLCSRLCPVCNWFCLLFLFLFLFVNRVKVAVKEKIWHDLPFYLRRNLSSEFKQLSAKHPPTGPNGFLSIIITWNGNVHVSQMCI